MLQDDPNFLPDLDFAPMDIDQLDFDTMDTEISQRSTLSPRSSQQVGSQIDLQQDVGGLIIPQSASSFIGGPVGGFGGGLSIRGSAGRGMDGGVLLDDDLGLMVGDDGALLDELPVRQPTATPSRGERTDVSGVSPKARSQQGGDQGAQDLVC